MDPKGNGTVAVFYDPKGHLQVCVKNDRNVGSTGMFLGDNPFHFVLPVTLCQISLVILTSRTLNYILRPLRTPRFICNVISGVLLGPSFLGRNQAYWDSLFPSRQAEFLVFAALLGATLFMFVIGLKMDVVVTLRAAKSTWRLGVVPFLASFGVLYGLLRVFKPPEHSSLTSQVARAVLSAVMSFSNFPVVSEALMELNLITTELGQIALSSAMLNDTIQWFLIAAQRIIKETEVKSAFLFLTCYWVLLLFCIFIVRPTMKTIARKTPVGKPVKEIYIVMILLSVLVIAAISDIIGISVLFGPLLFGLAIPNGPPLATTLLERSEVIMSEFFLPLYFVYIGMNTNLYSLADWRMFIQVQCILFAGHLAKMIACVLVCLTYDIRPKHGMVLGFISNIKGITELLAFARARTLKILDDQTFSHLVLCVVVMTAINTPLVKILYKRRPRVLHASSIHEGHMKAIQNTPRTSEFRIITCVHNEGNVRSIIALLEACNPNLESPLCVYMIHLIELLGKSTPILLSMNDKQNRKSLSANYPNTNHIMRAFENYTNNSKGPVTVIPFVNVAPYKNMHDAVCNLAQDKTVPFLIIPFHENDHTLDGHVSTSIRDLNTSFQNRAPCSVGILVDRYSRLSASSSTGLFHVGIFFIGGADDRDALALGIRMLGRPNMRVTLFRFVLMNNKWSGSKKQTRKEEEEEEIESMLDESLIDEFKARKFGRGSACWCEIVVEDGIEVMDAIRGLEGNYDLVMVGRRHNIGTFSDEEMSNFIENAEILGVFGDMLSSTEFCIGMVPVLVTQCGGKKPVNRFDRVGSGAIASQRIIG